MQNLGMGEIFMILLIALLVFGPKRLPEIARNLGKAWRVFQDETRKAQELLRDSIDLEDKKPATPAPTAGVVDRPDATPPAASAAEPGTPTSSEVAAAPAAPTAPPAPVDAEVEVDLAPARRYEDT